MLNINKNSEIEREREREREPDIKETSSKAKNETKNTNNKKRKVGHDIQCIWHSCSLTNTKHLSLLHTCTYRERETKERERVSTHEIAFISEDMVSEGMKRDFGSEEH